jgi:signal transduction histidine kinase
MGGPPPSTMATVEGRGRADVRAVLAVAFVALVGAVVVGVLATDSSDRVPAAVAAGLAVGVPAAVGLLAWRTQPDARFAHLLVAMGAASALPALSHSSHSLVYSVGRVSVYFVVPAMLCLMLAFPSGRLARRWDRRLVVGIAVLVGTLYLPTALFSDAYAIPAPWTSCTDDCPANAFALVDVDPTVGDAIRACREVLFTLATIAVLISLVARARGAAPLLRRALVPVVVVAAFQSIAFALYQWERRNGDVPEAVDVMRWIWLFTLPAVALSFAAGLLHRRLQVSASIQRLAAELRPPADAEQLRRGLASTLEDPDLRVVYRLADDPDRWVDESGRPTAAPAAGPGKAVTEVEAGGRLIAAVVHDAALGPDRRLVQTAAVYGLMVLENTRLVEELRESLRRLSEAEERRAAAATEERQRIERNLHDGAQQRLVALRINLAQLAGRIGRDAPDRAAELDVLGSQIDVTIDDMRRLAHTDSPPLLAEAGLVMALKAATRNAGLDIAVHDDRLERFPPEIERTVYFACLEATQNAVKHARGATAATIVLTVDDELHFEIVDDGAGFEAAARGGQGLANMAARVAAVGGKLTVHSTPGRGTRVVGTIPLARRRSTGRRAEAT